MSAWRRGAKPRRRRVGAVSAVLAPLLLFSFSSTGRAAEASWSFEPSSWDFGTLLPGSGPSPAKAFILENTGDIDLSAIFVGVGGSSGSGFAIAENTCGELAPAETCTIAVTFNPSTAGSMQGGLSVASKDSLAPPANAELSGTGAGPAVTIAPASQTFEPRNVGAGSSAAKTFEISNEGTLDLSISSISIANFLYSNADQFEVAGGSCSAGAIVPSGGSCTVKVVFSPTIPGFLAADVRIASNAPGLPYLATVEGFGVAPLWSPPNPPPFVAPRASIAHRPPKTTRKRHAVFWFRGSPTATRFACKIDSHGFVPCETPARFSRLAIGFHRFAVQAIDGNGRRGPTTSFRWQIQRP